MAHFAELDNGGIVLRVVVAGNDITTPDGITEVEQLGVDFCKDLFGGTDANWKQTSYNTFKGNHVLGKSQNRKNYAGIGYTYDSDKDAFYASQPYPSWELDENSCRWEAPIPYPRDERCYNWNEENQSWDLEDEV